MIALTALDRKGRSINTANAGRIGRMPGNGRVTGSLGASYYCPTSANRLPCPLEISDSALTRSFRFRIPQPPAPRGRRDRVYRTGLIPETGPTKVGPFSFWAGACAGPTGARPAPKILRHMTDAHGPEVRNRRVELNLPVG